MQNDQTLVIEFQQSAQKEGPFTQLLKRHQQRVYYQIKRMLNKLYEVTNGY